MCRTMCFVALLLCTATLPATAISLKWRSGASNLNFSAARRCTLMVQTGPSEPLPSQWQLEWVTRSSADPCLVLRPEAVTVADTARVRSVDASLSIPEAQSGQQQAGLYTAGSNPPTTARYIFDASGATTAKLRLVAFIPTSVDSSTFSVLQSSSVTLNGGVSSSYLPTVVRTLKTHPASVYRIKLAGAGLSSIVAATLVARDTSWHLPLMVTAQTDTTMTVEAEVGARLPAAVVQLTTGSGGSATAPIAADDVVTPLNPTTSAVYYDPTSKTIAKDFAFLYDWAGNFHLFYIKHNNVYPQNDSSFFFNEKCLAHVWSADLMTWNAVPDTAFRVQLHGWDNLHVWAPSFVQQGPTYYMFYTGVDSTGNQRIGYATSTSTLNTDNAHPMSWQRLSTWVLAANMTASHWADTTGFGYSGAQQFRDPYVVEDPDSAGHFLMFYVAEVAARKPTMAVGVAKSIGTDLTRWRDLGPMYSTDAAQTFGDLIDESPLVFPHTDLNANHTHRWWMLFTTNHAGGRRLQFTSTTANYSPADLDSTHWYGINRLPSYLDPAENASTYNSAPPSTCRCSPTNTLRPTRTPRTSAITPRSTSGT